MFALKHSIVTLGTQDPHNEILTGSYIPSEPSEAAYGAIFFAFALNDIKDLAPEIRAIIIESFQQHFYQDLDRNPELSFEEVLQVINDQAAKISSAEGITWAHNLNITLVVFSQNDLHLSVGGSASIYLLRGKHITRISEGLNPDNDTDNKMFISLASGNLLKDDRVILSTEHLENIIDTDAYKEALNKVPSPLSLPAMHYAQTMVINCQEAPAEEPMVHEIGHHAPVSADNTIEDLPGVPKNKLGNTMDLLKMNLKKSLERIFNRQRPLVRRPLQLSKVLAIGAVALVVILSVYAFANYQQNSSLKKSLQTLVTQVSRDREDAKTRAIYDKESAKNLLLADQRQLIEALPKTTDVIILSQINGELSEIKTLLATIDNIFRLDAPKIAFDLSTSRENFVGRGITKLGNDLYAFDNNALYKLIVDKIDRRTVVVNGDTTADIALIAPETKDNALVLYTEDKQVLEFKNGNFSFLTPPGSGSTWQPAQAIAEYIDRKFLYFLDPEGNTIWRYGRDTNGALQAPVSKNIAKLDYSKAVSLAVDGAVYVLSSDGTISKTYADEKQDFVIDGLTDPLNSPKKIVADKNQETGKLYILDATNSRVVVLNKNGKYLAQYILTGITDLIDIELVPSLTKDQLMVMSQSGKVYQIEINP
ncbi:hypothetical protein KBB08_01795 [Candidatus Gracilibacteria bacterium]|nr:hypothetical protein [Candidatus Gracilibacteria bacterium]